GLFHRGGMDGCEFVLRAEVSAPDEAGSLARALVHSIDAPVSIDPYELVVTLSVGIALYPLDGKNERELMFNADASMYHTKHTGRNGYHFFQPSMNMLAHTQLHLMNYLWPALERPEFSLVYPPNFHAPSVPIG
ncbi:diguanylate cyclase domain-containing protein, partial [Salmonella enterica]|uniref:diguanylate cyclase domain-containing protein n=1 Tax=Salmonella enterica TaxID=28901 RepID=UPI00398C3CB2